MKYIIIRTINILLNQTSSTSFLDFLLTLIEIASVLTISLFTNSSMLTSNNLLIFITLSMSGLLVPTSHLETACLDMPNFSAKSS